MLAAKQSFVVSHCRLHEYNGPAGLTLRSNFQQLLVTPQAKASLKALSFLNAVTPLSRNVSDGGDGAGKCA
jgi:hypothetical protein